MNKLDFAGRTAVVTGGAQGIGGAIVKRLEASGAKVAVWDLDGSPRVDVAEPSSVEAATRGTLEALGKIDILVNNAAMFVSLHEQPFTEIDVGLWDRVMAVNVRGPFLMAKHVSRHMMKARYGKIINIGSGTTTRGIPNMAHYVTSKGAVIAMTRTLSRELGEHGICINTLSPGFTLSETVLADNPHHVEMSRAGAVQRRALKRDMFPPDLLGALVFLSSSDSDFITGQTIAVDGGATNS
jgi:NAD(P)-dependent dehydrogenase (short-subunit alcohol dehydrogenase family)